MPPTCWCRHDSTSAEAGRNCRSARNRRASPTADLQRCAPGARRARLLRVVEVKGLLEREADCSAARSRARGRPRAPAVVTAPPALAVVIAAAVPAVAATRAHATAMCARARARARARTGPATPSPDHVRRLGLHEWRRADASIPGGTSPPVTSSARAVTSSARAVEQGGRHGREEHRTLKAAPVAAGPPSRQPRRESLQYRDMSQIPKSSFLGYRIRRIDAQLFPRLWCRPSNKCGRA